MIKAAVNGACGKMGNRIISIIHETEGITLSGCLEYADHKMIGRSIKEITGLPIEGIVISSDKDKVLSECDVLIDFSSPEGTIETLKTAAEKNRSVVIGTTGLLDEQKKIIQIFSKKIPCVFSPNMSVGINVMLNLLQKFAPVFDDDYDVEIIEAHHRFKKDAPSGTALKIAEVLASALDRDLEKVGRYERKGIIGARPKKEIGLQTIRAGDIIGDHTVMFGGIGERLEITHKAQSRDTFAKGAVRAAKWLNKKPAGLYDMHDVLGLQ